MSGKSSFLRGAALLTVTMFISKILGFIYVIPFTAMVGTQGYILFEYAYKPYVIMISIASMGIPMAVSKFVSKYNELGDFETGRRLFKSGSVILSITGVLWASILFLAAPTITGWLIDETQTTGNSSGDVIFVIRMISFALMVVPIMAMIRGYFQGYQKMNPTAISQVVEQLVRIAIILVGTFIVMYYGSGKITTAVGISTFAAFIGAIASMFVLMWYRKVYKNDMNKKNSENVPHNKPSLFKIYKELFFYSIPFVIVSLAIPIYQNIDIFSINPTLIEKGLTQEKAEYVNGIVAIVQKVVTIPIIFANAFALTLVPAITKTYIGNNKQELHNQITKTLQVIFFFTLPCAVVFYILPQETFGILLGTANATYGGEITRAYAIISLFFSFFVVTTSILQGINKQYFAVIGLLIGLVVKLLLSVPFISLYSGAGTAYSTMIGFSISVFVNLIVIKKYADFSFKELIKQAGTIVMASFLMLLSMLSVKYLATTYLPIEMTIYLRYLIIVGISGIIGSIVYFGVSYKLGLLQAILGAKINRFKKKKEA